MNKKYFPILFAFIIFFIGGSDVFAYDFAHWKGASVTDFGFRVVDNQWYIRSSNKQFEWLYRPDFPAGNNTLINIYQFGGNLYFENTTLKKGTATVQFALGYDDSFTGPQTCSWIDTFNGLSLEYSSDGNNWYHFELNSVNCTPQSGFIIIGYNLNIPNDLSFNRFAFGIIDDESIQNRITTLFTAVNIISSEDGTQAIINQNQIIIDQNNTQIQQGQETNENLEDIKDAITDDSIDVSTGNSFFDDFETNDFGLSDIVTMPLQLINTLTTNTCMSLNLTLPFVNHSFELPCMSSIYRNFFGDFFTLYQNITFGFVSYWVIVRIFNLVKDFKNPDHDEIEVLDL